MTFADQLKAEREKQGLSQADAAKKMGCSLDTLSKWERGLSEPSGYARDGALARLRKVKSQTK